MPQIVAYISTAVASLVAAAGASATVVAWTYGVTSFLLTYVAPTLILAGISQALAPKLPVAQRQADILELTLGESPREAILGTAATGGSLMDAWNYGNDNEWEVMRIALADHECQALLGYWVNETYYAFSADGAQAGFSSCLEIYWRPGTLTQTPPSSIVSNSGGRCTADDTAAGVAHVFAAYKINDQVWQSGRPRFRWHVKGAKLYDPRKDSTVSGGSGSHRWGTPSTYEWSENARICHYNFLRGIWTNGQLVVGAGRSADEAPPAEVIADANICDEDVALKGGGTEKRYRVGAVIRATESWADVEEDFALAMGGDLIERAGALAVDLGYGRSAVASFTDADLISGAKVVVQAKVSRADLVNTVRSTFVDPTQLWESAAAPLRRDTSAITADGEARERDLPLRLVTSQTQAQRLSKIALLRARMQRSATVTLGPRFCLSEVGDWVEWTSDRYNDGAARTYQVIGVTVDQSGVTTVQLREIASSAYAWTAASDEIDPTAAAPSIPSAPGAATISGFSASATTVSGGGVTIPAIAVTWTAVTDPTIRRVRIEYQRTAGGSILTEWSDAPASGVHVLTSGLTAEDWRVRVTPEAEPARDATTSSWTTVTVSALAAGTAGVAGSITGQGPGATAAGSSVLNSYVGLGDNQIINSELLGGDLPLGWEAETGNGTGLTITRALNLSGYSGQRNVAFALASGSPTGGGVFYGWRPRAGSLADLLRYAVPIAAGQRVYASVYLARHRCDGRLLILWYDAAGSQIGFDVVANGGRADGGANGDLANFDRLEGFITAPSGARFATLLPGGVAISGQSNPYIFWTAPMVAFPSAAQTVGPPYAPGPADRNADRYQYLSDSGRLTNGRLGLPINVALGYGATFNPVYPLSSSSSSSISVAATTITWPGDSLSIGSATISGLSADTIYSVFWDTQTSAFVAVSSGATAYITNTSRYIAFGTQRTQLSGGGFTPPPDPPDGGGGGGGGGDYIP